MFASVEAAMESYEVSTMIASPASCGMNTLPRHISFSLWSSSSLCPNFFLIFFSQINCSCIYICSGILPRNTVG